MNLRSLPHLTRRFFGSLRSRRPGPEDQARIASSLTPEAARLFFAMAPMDQAHCLTVARRVADAAPDRPDLVKAALLHDVGKRHSRLGVPGRSVASLLAILHLPVSRRGRSYLDHGALGARDLELAGESGIVTAFAAHHHSGAPPGTDGHTWDLLRKADED